MSAGAHSFPSPRILPSTFKTRPGRIVPLLRPGKYREMRRYENNIGMESFLSWGKLLYVIPPIIRTMKMYV